MTKMVRQLGMKCEIALDLTTTDENGEPLDLSKPKMQQKALRLLDEIKPAVLILSPPCTMFSAMQNINVHQMKKSRTKARVQEAVAHFAFAVLLCIRKSQRGGTFEYPVGASSWSTQLASLLSQCPGTKRVNFELCMLGMRSKDASGSAPAKKRTSVMTNSPELADAFAQFQCDSSHRHVVLEGGRAKACQEYPDEFCEVVLRAIQTSAPKVLTPVFTPAFTPLLLLTTGATSLRN